MPFLCGLIIFLLLDQTGLGGQMLLAALIHELGHIATMLCLGQQPKKIVFGGFGIRLEKKDSFHLSYGKEILIYASGPLMNFLVAALFCKSPAMYRIHLLLGCFNLLPMGVLDGGQILRCLLQQKLEISKADRILQIFTIGVGAGLVVLSVFVFCKSGYNLSLFVTTIYLLWMAIAGNGEI